jgi:hypothetical protein
MLVNLMHELWNYAQADLCATKIACNVETGVMAGPLSGGCCVYLAVLAVCA